MGDQEGAFSAQLILKNQDGVSILDSEGPLTAELVEKFAATEARIAEVRKKLTDLGFETPAYDRTTLSVTGPCERFTEVFGLEADAGQKGVEAHATKIPNELSDAVADVIVPPPPEFFGTP